MHSLWPGYFPATLLSALWTLPALLLLQHINLHAHWWKYAPGSAAELLVIPAVLAIVYSAGLATWDEDEDVRSNI